MNDDAQALVQGVGAAVVLAAIIYAARLSRRSRERHEQKLCARCGRPWGPDAQWMHASRFNKVRMCARCARFTLAIKLGVAFAIAAVAVVGVVFGG